MLSWNLTAEDMARLDAATAPHIVGVHCLILNKVGSNLRENYSNLQTRSALAPASSPRLTFSYYRRRVRIVLALFGYSSESSAALIVRSSSATMSPGPSYTSCGSYTDLRTQIPIPVSVITAAR